ncbi:MAG: glycosyltransferase family 39 protein [Pyrinomonadaceae bacterium]
MHKSGIKELSLPFPKLLGMLCLVISISSLVVFPRLLSLEFHWLGDETLWLVRSHNFIQSLQDGNLKEIPVLSHPGVTTMWLGGTSLWLRHKGNFAAAINLETKSLLSPNTLAATRTGVALTITVAILSAWYLLFRLLGWWTSAFAILFISIDPFYLALSRILHTDALAASFTLLAVLSLLVYLEQSQRSSYVIFSGICFGLACLSKITALVLVLYLPLLLGFYKIFNVKRHGNKPNFSILHLCLAWLGAAFLTSICLWPSLWTLFADKSLLPFFGVLLLLGITYWSYEHIQIPAGERIRQPQHLTISLLMIAILGAGVWKVGQPHIYGIYETITTPHEVAILHLGKIVYDPGLSFYLLILSLRSLPFTHPLFILGLTWFVCHRERSEDPVRRIFFALLILLPIFIVPISFAEKKISRYVLPVCPYIDILAAIGFSILLKQFINQKEYVSLKEFVAYALKRPLAFVSGLFIFILATFFQIISLLALHPYYIAYYNPIWRVADVPKLFAIGGEVGADQAGLYLSRKPNAEQLIVSASPAAAPVIRFYFPGRVIQLFESALYPDYEVVHLYDVQIRRDNHDIKRRLEYVVHINGIDFAWIYK